jgi:hypothetical protein
MKIKGVVNVESSPVSHWMVVSGFERETDGTPGPAESTNRMSDDLIVAI